MSWFDILKESKWKIDYTNATPKEWNEEKGYRPIALEKKEGKHITIHYNTLSPYLGSLCEKLGDRE